jgi:hypothetical protein
MPAEQLRIRRLHPALLGAGNRMPRHEARGHAAKGPLRRAHHIALGTADISQDRLPQVHLSQHCKQLFHGQDGHGELDHVSTFTRERQVGFTAIHHAQLNGQLARLRVQVDAHYFTAQPAFTQALGEGTADQAQTDYHQATDHRHNRLQCSDINHGPEPWPTPPGSDCFQPASRW